MADKKADKNNDDGDAKGGSKKGLIMGVLAVVLGAGGFVVGGKLSGGEAPVVEAVEEPEKLPTEEIGEIIELEPVNVNLADGHYLRLAVAIAMAHHDDEEEKAASGGGGHGATDEGESHSIEVAPASDLVLTTFSGRSMAELTTPEGREQARHDLHEGLVAFYGEDIATVLFTEFVMQ